MATAQALMPDFNDLKMGSFFIMSIGLDTRLTLTAMFVLWAAVAAVEV